jgi:hypothetical protein
MCEYNMCVNVVVRSGSSKGSLNYTCTLEKKFFDFISCLGKISERFFTYSIFICVLFQMRPYVTQPYQYV